MKTTTNTTTKTMNKTAPAITAILTALTLLLTTTIHATTLLTTNLAQLAETAQSAFVIRIDNTQTTTTPDGRSVDIITGQITDPLFGSHHTSQTITWQQFRLGPNVRLPGMPTYQPGKEYLIYLSGPGPGTGNQSPVGLGQGTFTVLRNPQTGTALVRNEFMNSGLTRGLDTTAIATDIANQNPATRSLNPTARNQEIQNIKTKLTPTAAGNTLDTIKQATRLFRQKAQQGQPASQLYQTTTTLQLQRR